MSKKTLWKKEKILFSSIFSFSPKFSKGFFSRVIISQDCVIKSSLIDWWDWCIMPFSTLYLFWSHHNDDFLFIPFPNKPLILRVCSRTVLKTLAKGENARKEQYLLFSQCFQPFCRTFCH